MAGLGWRAVGAVTAAVAVLVTAACGSDGGPRNDPPKMPASGTGVVHIGGHQVTVHVPASYDPARPAPLVVGLHGYTSNAHELESYLQLTPEADRRGFVYVYPEGSIEDDGHQFWNATDACCAFQAEPDDAGYLSGLISTVQDAYRIDRARVYLIGHSNGGFMAFRMACDHADQVTAIVTLNGATWNDPARCRPSEPVSVLAVHGNADETVSFTGGSLGGGATIPSAAGTVAQWAGFNRCTGSGRAAAPLDLVPNLPGAETSVRTYGTDCAGGSTVQAWTMDGGRHVPLLGRGFAPAVTDFLLAQKKP